MWLSGYHCQSGGLCPDGGASLTSPSCHRPLLFLQTTSWFQSLGCLTCFPHICFSFQSINLASSAWTLLEKVPCFSPPLSLPSIPSRGRMAPEPLLGGCYWPQSSGQCQAVKALAALRFQLLLPQGLLCRGQISGSLGFSSVLTAPTSHPIYHGKGGPHAAFYPVYWTWHPSAGGACFFP